MRPVLPAAVLAVAVIGLCVPLGCGSQGGGTPAISTPQSVMLDSQECGVCHSDHFDDWMASMHAYAADDPVFLAMNKRGQRETNGQLGNFCVNCHAPMAVRLAPPGQNVGQDLANGQAIDQPLKGVTCYFCHSIESVDPAHNNGLVKLATDLVMRGELTDPIPNRFHNSAYSTLHDRDNLDSAAMCGTCHDIVTPMIAGAGGAHIERTFCEWSKAGFNVPNVSTNTCASKCHMTQSDMKRSIAPKLANTPPRYFHEHDFPAVDVAVDPTYLASHPQAVQGPQTVQTTLDAGVLRGALCVTKLGGIRVVIDPFGLGHQWPSGAAQDRRLWAEVIAYNGSNVIYKSGVVDDRMPVTADNDPDLWLLRDDMLDAQSRPVDMFWQAVTSTGDEFPTPQFIPSQFSAAPPHIGRSFPKDGTPLSQLSTVKMLPDRVTLRMRLQPIGLDVLDALVTSGDLDPSVRMSAPAPFDVTLIPHSSVGLLEWKAAEASGSPTFPDPNDGNMTCVGAPDFDPGAPSAPQSGVTCKL